MVRTAEQVSWLNDPSRLMRNAFINNQTSRQLDVLFTAQKIPILVFRRYCSRHAQLLAVKALHNNYHWWSDSKPFDYVVTPPLYPASVYSCHN